MSIENTASLVITLGGQGYTASQGGTDYTGEVDIDVALGTAKTGTLTTRTDANTGTFTMDTGHGITTGARLDVYWTTSGVNYCQRGITVGTVSGNSVPFDSGVGDDLPDADTAITAMVPTAWTGSITEANIEGFAFSISGIATTTGCQVCVGTGTFTENAAFLLQGATWISTVAAWSDGIPGWTSPLDAATTITKIYFSHGDAVNSGTFRARIGHT